MARRKQVVSRLETVNEPARMKPVQFDESNEIELVYVGTADTASRVGAVTNRLYRFGKDRFKMPILTKIDVQDSAILLAELGKVCCGRKPLNLFVKKSEWDLDQN